MRNTDAGTIFPTDGVGYAWEYNQPAADPGTYIIGGPGTAQPGADWHNSPWVDATANYPGGATGYYVARYKYHDNASASRGSATDSTAGRSEAESCVPAAAQRRERSVRTGRVERRVFHIAMQ